MRSTPPEEVRVSFDRWFTDRDSCDEKEEALNSIWDNLSLTSAPIPEDPLSIISEAEKIEGFKTTRRKDLWIWISSAIAACMTIFALIGWNLNDMHECTCCLVSSSESKGEFNLPDGSTVYLNKGSKLYYSNDLTGKLREVTLEGEAYFDVEKDAERPFIVHANDMSIKVLGTRFTVSAYEDSPVTAYLEEGSIMASAPSHDPVILAPNNAVSYDPSNDRLVTFKETASDHTAWVDSKLEFVNKPLKDIIDCLEHWYCVSITCNDMDLASEIRLSMTIRQENIEEIFSAISAIADLSYIIDSNGNMKISFDR